MSGVVLVAFFVGCEDSSFFLLAFGVHVFLALVDHARSYHTHARCPRRSYRCVRLTTPLSAVSLHTGNLLEQLSRGAAANAANALARAAARLLVETRHRPARRQAAVAVANLTKTPQLRAALLASDPPAGGGGFRGRVSSADDLHAQQRRLVESLVVLSMGRDDGSAARKNEEEIGMRRECMRALVGLAESHVVRDMVRE